jgi:hypothetical protein
MSRLDEQLAKAERLTPRAPQPAPLRVRGEPSDRWVGWHATVRQRDRLEDAAMVVLFLALPFAALLAWWGAVVLAVALGVLGLATCLWLWVALRDRTAHALPQARALVARLPFEATSYLEALRSPPLVVPRFHHESTDVRVQLVFDRVPPTQTVQSLLALVSESARYSESTATVHVGGYNPWPKLERLLVEVLEPLHEQYPLRSLRVEVERRLKENESED